MDGVYSTYWVILIVTYFPPVPLNALSVSVCTILIVNSNAFIIKYLRIMKGRWYTALGLWPRPCPLEIISRKSWASIYWHKEINRFVDICTMNGPGALKWQWLFEYFLHPLFLCLKIEINRKQSITSGFFFKLTIFK